MRKSQNFNLTLSQILKDCCNSHFCRGKNWLGDAVFNGSELTALGEPQSWGPAPSSLVPRPLLFPVNPQCDLLRLQSHAVHSQPPLTARQLYFLKAQPSDYIGKEAHSQVIKRNWWKKKKSLSCEMGVGSRLLGLFLLNCVCTDVRDAVLSVFVGLQ